MFAYDYRMRHAYYAMTTTRIATCNSTYHILKTDVRARKSRRRPLVSLSHARKSYCVNWPIVPLEDCCMGTTFTYFDTSCQKQLYDLARVF